MVYGSVVRHRVSQLELELRQCYVNIKVSALMSLTQPYKGVALMLFIAVCFASSTIQTLRTASSGTPAAPLM
jgi:hypothetical protein